MKKCEKCGRIAESNFCPECGGKMLTEEASFSEIELPEVTSESENEVPSVDTDMNQVLEIEGEKKQHQYREQKNKKGLLISISIIVAVVVVIVVVVIGSSKNSFQNIYDEYCDPVWASIGEDGSYLTIDTNPYDDDDDGLAYPLAFYAIEDINEVLQLPSSLIEDMKDTTGFDGRQEEVFDNISVSWKYHPDTGLEVRYKYQ